MVAPEDRSKGLSDTLLHETTPAFSGVFCTSTRTVLQNTSSEAQNISKVSAPDDKHNPIELPLSP